MDKELLSVREAARLLSVQGETLRRWERSGKLAAIRIGTRGDRRFRKADLMALLEAGEKSRQQQETQTQQHNELFLDEVRQRFVGRQWYHQRFDASPLLLSIIGIAHIKRERRKPAGTESLWHFAFYSEGKCDWFHDQADFERGTDVVIKKAKATDNLGKRLMQGWRTDEAAFDDYFEVIKVKDLTRLSDRDLADEFEAFYQRALKRFTSSSIIDAFALGSDRLISEKMRKETGPHPSESAFHKLFSALTAPTHQSFITGAELAVLAIAARVADGESLGSVSIQAELTRLQNEFYWLQNNYVRGQVLSVRHFENEVRSWLESGRDLHEEIDKLSNQPAQNRRLKEQLYKQYRISKELRKLLELSEYFTRWQDERKRATYLMADIATRLLDEMAQRRTIDPTLLKYLVPHEVSAWFLHQTISGRELRARKTGCIVYLEKNRAEVYTGSAMTDKVHDLILGGEATEEVMDLRGLVASTGRAIGPAKILLSAREVNKVQEGDVLIAVMTRPDYVPAMKRAVAIVTDEGGITSHAAIVSRELGVPCIIGTKAATRVFKDGDIVEVNANHNWIRKIGSNSSK